MSLKFVQSSTSFLGQKSRVKFIKNQYLACLLMLRSGLMLFKAQHNLVVNTFGQLHEKQDHRKKNLIIQGKM